MNGISRAELSINLTDRIVFNNPTKYGSLKQKSNIDSRQFSIFPSLTDSVAAEKLRELGLDNAVLKFTRAPRGGYSATITLTIPCEFSEAEASWLSQQTDDWDGWGDSPGETLTELGRLVESALAGIGGVA